MVNWLLIAIAGEAILGSSAVFDKLLLLKQSIEPWAYAFWLGIFGLFAAVLLPFGFHATPFPIILLALAGGPLFISSVLLQFFALEYFEASEALPLVGSIGPLLTLIAASIFLHSRLGLIDVIGFIFLVLAGVSLFLAEKKKLRLPLLLTVTASAILASASLIVMKFVFQNTSFIPGLFWLKVGDALTSLGFLLIPAIRKKIIHSRRINVKNRLMYVSNRAYAGLGSVFIIFAVSRTNPALIDALSNLKYFVIFILAWILVRERFRGSALVWKLVASIFIVVGTIALAFGEYARSLPPVSPTRNIIWGVSFSEKFAKELEGDNWQNVYRAMLDDLHPARLRLVAYWDLTEPEQNHYDFSDLDWQVREADAQKIPVVLAVGMKLPRWPECHVPGWASGMSVQDRDLALLPYVQEVIMHYRNDSNIVMWQVENEPFLSFGRCIARDANFVSEEVRKVKMLDSRPVLVTDSGEIGEWVRAANVGDVFGTSIYRKICPRFGCGLTGTIEYPLSPSFFRVKENIVRFITGKTQKRFIVAELQAEPWADISLAKVPHNDAVQLLSPQYFEETIRFAKDTGFDEYYLWGAEWWYFMRERYHDARYWDIAKQVFENKF